MIQILRLSTSIARNGGALSFRRDRLWLTAASLMALVVFFGIAFATVETNAVTVDRDETPSSRLWLRSIALRSARPSRLGAGIEGPNVALGTGAPPRQTRQDLVLLAQVPSDNSVAAAAGIPRMKWRHTKDGWMLMKPPVELPRRFKYQIGAIHPLLWSLLVALSTIIALAVCSEAEKTETEGTPAKPVDETS